MVRVRLPGVFAVCEVDGAGVVGCVTVGGNDSVTDECCR